MKLLSAGYHDFTLTLSGGSKYRQRRVHFAQGGDPEEYARSIVGSLYEGIRIIGCTYDGESK